MIFGSLGRSKVHTSSDEALQNSIRVTNNDIFLQTAGVRVGVGLLSFNLGCRWRRVTFDINGLDDGIVEAIRLDVRVVDPINLSTSPVDSALGVASKSARPKGKLNTGRSLREVEGFGCGIPSISLINLANRLAVDFPSNALGLPVDRVGVVISECVSGGVLISIRV